MSDQPIVGMHGVSFCLRRNAGARRRGPGHPGARSVCIVGPNGGGKTTLLKLILGLLKPDRGTVRVFGQPPKAVRLRMGYMPQHVRHDPHFPVTVEDIVLMGRLGRRGLRGLFGWYDSADRRAAPEALQQVDMQDLLRRPFSALSRRPAATGAHRPHVRRQPELLLLDEPTANIDTLVEARLFDILRKINQRMTVVMVSHDLGFVSNMVKSVICVNRQAVVHPTGRITNELIQEMYGGDVRMVRTATWYASASTYTRTREGRRMIEFFEALADPDVVFLRYALLAGVLASVSLGIIGAYVVARRISYLGGAISHCVLGGIGPWALFAGGGWLCLVSSHARRHCGGPAGGFDYGLDQPCRRGGEEYNHQRLWAVGMAVGLLFFAKTPGYADPMSYLFGDILMISRQDLWTVLGLDFLVAGAGLLFYHKFMAVCFDEEFAELRGVPVKFYYLLLLCLTALTVVLLVRVVGIVMVVALLTLPAAVAGYFAHRLWQMMFLATLGCAAFITVGLGVSYRYELPAGPTIIMLAAAVYLAVILGSRLKAGAGG